MSGGIFVLQENGSLVEMRQEPYNAETVLQRLVEEYPALLAGDQMDSNAPRRWLLVKREMEVPDASDSSGRWYLDHLFLDQDGIPTLVEVKRSTDTRIRREVVGQMLDYAANGVAYWPVGTLQTNFVATWKEKATQKLADFLMVDENDAAGTDNLDGSDTETHPAVEGFWQKVSANLQAGKLRLLFVADEIPTELQRIIEFLNEKMDSVEVLSVEIKQFAGQQMKTLVPRVIGQTAKAVTRKSANASSGGRQWNETTFFEDMTARGNVEATNAARAIFNWVRSQGIDVWWGSGKRYGSCVPYFHHNDRSNQLFVLWSNGYIEFYFQHLGNKPPFNDITKREELLGKLNAIANVDIPKSKIASRPSVSLTMFSEAGSLLQLLQTMDWVIQEIKAT